MNVAGTQLNQPIPRALAQITTMPTDTLVISDDLNKRMMISHEDYEASFKSHYIFKKIEITHETYGRVSVCYLG